MRKMSILALTISAAFLATNVSGAASTQAELLLGEWDQVGIISSVQGGQEIIISDSEVEYRNDGTFFADLTIKIGGLPETFASYEIQSEAAYSLEGSIIHGEMTGVQVTPNGTAPQGVEIAGLMQTGFMEDSSSETIIIKLTNDLLVVKDSETGIESTYKRG